MHRVGDSASSLWLNSAGTIVHIHTPAAKNLVQLGCGDPEGFSAPKIALLAERPASFGASPLGRCPALAPSPLTDTANEASRKPNHPNRFSSSSSSSSPGT